MVKADEWLDKVEKEIKKAEKKGQISQNVLGLITELRIHQSELINQNLELIESQKELSKLYSQYQELYDNAPVGYFSLDKDGVIRNANIKGSQLIEMDKNTLIGLGFVQFIFKDDYRKYYRALHIAIDKRKNQSLELRFRNIKSYFYAFMEIMPLYDKEDEKYRIIITDITKRKKAEEELRKSEEKFRALVIASSEVVYRMNSDWSEMLQLNSKNFLANTEKPNTNWLQEYVPSDDQPMLIEAKNKAIKTKNVFELEHRVIQADGNIGWVYSRAVPILDSNGEIIEWFGYADDITQRKLNEEELRRLATVVKDSNDAITVQDFDGNIIAWNHSAEKMYGWNEKEALKMNILNTVPESKREEMSSFIKGIQKGKFIESFETQRLTKDGRVLDVWLTITKLVDDMGNTVSVATTERDITELKR